MHVQGKQKQQLVSFQSSNTNKIFLNTNLHIDSSKKLQTHKVKKADIRNDKTTVKRVRPSSKSKRNVGGGVV